MGLGARPPRPSIPDLVVDNPGRHLGRRRDGPAGRRRIEAGPRRHGRPARVGRGDRGVADMRLAGVYQVRGIIRSAPSEGCQLLPAGRLHDRGAGMGKLDPGGRPGRRDRPRISRPAAGSRVGSRPGSTRHASGGCSLEARPRGGPYGFGSSVVRRRTNGSRGRGAGWSRGGLGPRRSPRDWANSTAPGMNTGLNVGAAAGPVTWMTRIWPSASRIRSLTPGMCQASRL